MGKMENFLAERQSGLGGSDMASILGLGGFKTPVEIYLEKTGRMPADESNLAMRFGVFAEDFVAREYSLREGVRVERYNKVLRKPGTPLIAHLDRLVIPEGQACSFVRKTGEIRAKKVLECKTVNAFSAMNQDEWGPDGTDQAPMPYCVQTWVYMALTGCPQADIAALVGGSVDFRVYHLDRDLEVEAEMIARACEWWDRHVVNDTPPEPIKNDDLKLLYPRDKGNSVEATPEIINDLALMNSYTNTASDTTDLADALKLKIKSFIGDAAFLTIAGKPVWSYKSNKDRSDVNWQAVAYQLGQGYGKSHVKHVIERNATHKPGARVFRAVTSKE